MLQKRKSKKKDKKVEVEENDEAPAAPVESKKPQEMTAEDLADEEFGPVKKKAKKGKDKKEEPGK